MKQKIAFFDFDDTLIHGDSIAYLLKYWIKKKPLSIFNFIKVGWYYIGHKIGNQPINKTKSALLFPLKHMDEAELEQFFKNQIEPMYYPNVVQELIEKKQQGYLVYIVSASVEAYLRFCELPADVIMGTRVEIIEGKYTHKMVGNNCKNEEKVIRINKDLNQKGIKIDYENSFAYSDSLHDVPMLRLVKNRVKINIADGAMTPFIIKE